MASAEIEIVAENASFKLPKNGLKMFDFDVYDGKGVPEGMVSLAYAIQYRATNRTLTDKRSRRRSNI